MEYIHRLPFILSALMTIIVGFSSYRNTDEFKTIYSYMAITMIVFFIFGTLAKNTLLKTIEENEIKKLEKEKLEFEENLRLKEEERLEIERAKKEKSENPRVIDFKVDDSMQNDEFVPINLGDMYDNNEGIARKT